MCSKKKVLVFGATGMLGSTLCPHLTASNYQVLTVGRSVADYSEMDLTDVDAIIKLLTLVKPAYVINLAAATDVDKCELDVAMAVNANTIIPKAISTAISMTMGNDTYFLHVSTDQVYDGKGDHHEEFVRPINVYGLSKLAGEFATDERWTCIFRTNFFGTSILKGRSSFSDWIIHSLREKRQIRLFHDVKFSALHMSSLCDIVTKAMAARLLGTFNLGSKNGISKADFGMSLARQLDLDISSVLITSVKDSCLKASRPLDMTLNVDKLESALGIVCPDIQIEIKKTAMEYLNARQIV